jgi:hypothetical protein
VLLALCLCTANSTCVVEFHAGTMPLAWIHDLSKQQVEKLASLMGTSTNGTLDDLRKRVKEKWIAILNIGYSCAVKYRPRANFEIPDSCEACF